MDIIVETKESDMAVVHNQAYRLALSIKNMTWDIDAAMLIGDFFNACGITHDDWNSIYGRKVY